MEAEVLRYFQQAGPADVIQAPPVFTLSQWARDRATRIGLLRGEVVACTPGQDRIRGLWASVIKDAVNGISAEESFACSADAMNADRLLSQWVENRRVPQEGMVTADFSGWRREVHASMKGEHWFSPGDWISHFILQIGQDSIPRGILPASVTLSGFVELTALELRMIDALQANGVEFANANMPGEEGSDVYRQGFADLDREISAAAGWAQSQVASGCGRVAVIINGLDSLAAKVRRIFQNHFHPQSLVSLSECHENSFSMQATGSLAGHPVVAGAILLLKLALGGKHQRHDFSDISGLLLSGCCHGNERERFERARLEVMLRQTGYFSWSLSKVLDRISRHPNPASLQQLRHSIEAVTGHESGRSPPDLFLQWLQLWGWPGQMLQDAASKACQARFLQVLEKLTTYEFNQVAPCFRQLLRICGEEKIPAIGGAFSPVQILTPEQAYGQQFDAAWVANLRLDNWPPRPVSNPYITLRGRQRIPRASEEGTLVYAREVTRALRRCAPVVYFSWCDRLDDLPISASPLIEDIERATKVHESLTDLWPRICPDAGILDGYRHHPWLHPRTDTRGFPVNETGSSQLRGAVALLNMQSGCPLAAYLVFRLDARMERWPEPFSDATFRGQLVHAALERLYRECRGGKSRPHREKVSEALQAALDEHHASSRLLPALMIAEQDLLKKLVSDWLKLDKDIGSVICEVEWKEQVSLEGFEAELRIDRIDTIADGRQVLIDYKTGNVKGVSEWGKERLGNVQLPMYATQLTRGEARAPAGIAMASLGFSETRLFGLGDESFSDTYGVNGFGSRPAPLAKQFSSWQDALETWDRQIKALMSEFREGDARHQLFDENALKYAGLEGLLRSEELQHWHQEHEQNDRR